MSSSTSDDIIDLPPGVTRDSSNRLRFEGRFISTTDVQDMINGRASDVDGPLTLEQVVEEADLNAENALVVGRNPTNDDLYYLLRQVIGKLNEMHADHLSFRQRTEETFAGVQENMISLMDNSAKLKIGFNRIQTALNDMQTGNEGSDDIQVHMETLKEITL